MEDNGKREENRYYRIPRARPTAVLDVCARIIYHAYLSFPFIPCIDCQQRIINNSSTTPPAKVITR
jgi:hypothetical protein